MLHCTLNAVCCSVQLRQIETQATSRLGTTENQLKHRRNKQMQRNFVWQLHCRDATRQNIFNRRHISENTTFWLCHTVPGTESVSICQQHSTAWSLLFSFRSLQILSAVSLILPSLLRQTDRQTDGQHASLHKTMQLFRPVAGLPPSLQLLLPSQLYHCPCTIDTISRKQKRRNGSLTIREWHLRRSKRLQSETWKWHEPGGCHCSISFRKDTNSVHHMNISLIHIKLEGKWPKASTVIMQT